MRMSPARPPGTMQTFSQVYLLSLPWLEWKAECQHTFHADDRCEAHTGDVRCRDWQLLPEAT